MWKAATLLLLHIEAFPKVSAKRHLSDKPQAVAGHSAGSEEDWALTALDRQGVVPGRREQELSQHPVCAREAPLMDVGGRRAISNQ